MKANDIFDREEIKRLTRPSDLQGWASVATTWGLIGLALAIASRWPSVVSIVAALLLIGGRQLGLAVLAHECAHRSLFETPWLNRVVGRWLCGGPIWVDVERYRIQHLGHHAHAGTDKDPDRGLATGFPISRRSMWRKVVRDLSGWTGVKRIIGLALMDAGVYEFTLSDQLTRAAPLKGGLAAHVASFVRNAAPTIVTNALLAAACWYAGALWAYGLWLGAYLTTHSLVLRIRSIAEHACTELDAPDPMRHTRTTLASPLARLLIAPHHVNYHAEHHLLPTAPHYRLAQMHRLLVERGAFDDGFLAPSYRAVFATVVKSA